MKFLNHIFNKHRSIAASILVILGFIVLINVFAAAPPGGYAPGATNDPDCAPNDADCFVQASPFEEDSDVIKQTSTTFDENFVFGSPQLDDDSDPDHQSRFFFNKTKSAFRAGSATGTAWDDGNIASYSAAFGLDTVASGLASTAFGEITDPGKGSLGPRSTSGGTNSLASGDSSFAFGYYATASSNSTVALGAAPTASGYESVAFGSIAAASGTQSAAIGYGTKAPAYAQVATGSWNLITGSEDPSTWVLTDPVFVVGNGDPNGGGPGVPTPANALTVLKSGNVGIGTASPGAKLQIKGDSSVNTDYAFVAEDFGDELIFRVENGGNVVVGNGSYSSTAEYNQFEVNKDISGDIGGQMVLTNYVAPAVGNAVSINSKVNTNFAGAFMSSRIETKSNGGNDNDLNFYLYDGSTPGGNLKLTINNNGNVGIGAATPTNILEVGDGTGQRNLVVNGGNSSNDGASIRFQAAGADQLTIGHYSAIFGGAFDNTFTFDNGSSHILMAPGGNNVGIGHNGTFSSWTPARPLHIRDVMRIEPTSSAPSSPADGDIYYDSDNGDICIYGAAAWHDTTGAACS